MNPLYHRVVDKLEITLDFLGRLTLFRLFICFLLIPVLVFWRPYFFFRADDWTALLQMVENPLWQYLNYPDAEQWFPFFHLVYYGLIKLAGSRYSLLVLVNCLLTGVNAFLVFQFFRVHLNRSLALILALIYAGAAVHGSTVWFAYNLCYVLCFGFFLGSLLLTERFCHRTSWLTLGGIGLCSLLSLLSHSFAIMAIAALPLYGLLLGPEGKRNFWPLAAVIAAVYLCFGLGYSMFAGTPAASSHNRELISGLPGPAYYLFVLTGTALAPTFHLFRFQLFGLFIPGLIFLLIAVGLTIFKGNHRERLLCLWIFLVNLLPFLLVGLVRYKMAPSQAANTRYGVFTLMGALLLAGIAWRILRRQLPGQIRAVLLSLSLLAVIIIGQVATLMHLQNVSRQYSAQALACYRNLPPTASLEPAEANRLFCPGNNIASVRQAIEIRRFLDRP
jgi:hypothetical protein